jgi:hypothetical protein
MIPLPKGDDDRHLRVPSLDYSKHFQSSDFGEENPSQNIQDPPHIMKSS